MKALFKALGFLAWLVGAAIARGYVLAKLWSWFVVSQLHAEPLSVAGAIGVATIPGMLMFRREKSASPTKMEVVEGVLTALLTPFVFLGIGWLVKLFL